MIPASGASVRQWERQGWGQPLLRTGLIQQIEKTVFQSKLVHPHPMFVDISKTLFIFSWQQPVKKEKKNEFTKAFSLHS